MMDRKAAIHYARTTPHPLDHRVRLSGSADGLHAIHHPGVKAVIWQRQRNAQDAALIGNADIDTLESITMDFAQAANGVQTLLARLFNAEVRMLAGIYNSLTTMPIGISPDDILLTTHYQEGPLAPEDGWPDHHAELGYEIRLISAFTGRGTEWVTGDLTKADVLKLNKINLTENAWGKDRHQYVGTGDVLVIKGDAYQECEESEKGWSHEWLVHREPLPQPGIPRLGIIMPFS